MDSQRQATLKANGRNSRLVNSHLASEAISSLFLNEQLLDLCDTFFGGRLTSIYTSLFFQEGTKQPLHRDAPVFCTLPENLFLGCWFALEDSRIENGALMGVPFSNQTFSDDYHNRYKIGLERLEEIDAIEFSDDITWAKYQKYVNNTCESLGLKQEAIEADAGDIIVWHPLFLHGGLPHKSEATRHSVVMHVAPEGVQVHGSYLFFTPQNSIQERSMVYIEAPGSSRKMKQDLVTFSPDKQ